MTSIQKSSGHATTSIGHSDVESLAGVFHPHAIEVQDFASYALILDLRPRAEYEEDHIPGAISIPAPDAPAEDGAWPDRLVASVRAVAPRSAVRKPLLLYCGREGRVSRPAAESLRDRGMTVDVLPGGWINYRRWVQAGLELLPRMLTFQVIGSSHDGEASWVLDGLRDMKRQVLDLGRLAERRPDTALPLPRRQPQQAWFESRLVQELRHFDPRAAVWTSGVGTRVGNTSVPGSLQESLALARIVMVSVNETRQPDEQNLRSGREAIAEWREASDAGARSDALPIGRAARPSVRMPLPPLLVDSFDRAALDAALRAWLPKVERGLVNG